MYSKMWKKSWKLTCGWDVTGDMLDWDVTSDWETCDTLDRGVTSDWDVTDVWCNMW